MNHGNDLLLKMLRLNVIYTEVKGLGTRLVLDTLTCFKPMIIWPKMLRLKSIWKR